ncbi:MAG: hypothetical protein HOW97_34320 [Catenulispora sp.]|nr:hypothetical protein [Catenulispora sp.]
MSHGSEHEDEDLHTAFGEQVAHLSIGSSPTAAVLKDGAVLRGRRRLALASGVAALAVLPIAAFAAFAPGGGGTLSPGAGSRTPDPKHLGDYLPLPSPSVITPQTDPTAKTVAPAAEDFVRVLTEGTIDGQHWRLVQVGYMIAGDDNAISPWGATGLHPLPLSQQGQDGVQSCMWLGVQWGDRPAGTVPDYRFSGSCQPSARKGSATVVPLMSNVSTNLPPSKAGAVTAVTATVDSSRVASTTLAIAGRVSAHQPVITDRNSQDGYCVYLVDPSYDRSGEAMLLTLYDAKGKVLESQVLQSSVRPTP